MVNLQEKYRFSSCTFISFIPSLCMCVTTRNSSEIVDVVCTDVMGLKVGGSTQVLYFFLPGL